MFISDKSDLSCLDFKPRGHCFRGARIEWSDLILNGSVADPYSPLVDLSDQPVNSVLFDLYGVLTFVECLELFHALAEHPRVATAMNWEAFFKTQDRHFSGRTKELFEKLNKLPMTFRDWCFHKKISEQDLLPLNALSDLSEFLNHTSSLTLLSRSQGKKAIDLMVDLILMDKKLPQGLSGNQGDQWLQALEALRYPELQKRQNTSVNEKLPKYMEIKPIPQGDRTLKRLQVTFSDPEDLKTKLQRFKPEDQLSL